MSLTTIQNMLVASIICMVLVMGGVIYLGSFSSYDSSIDKANNVSGYSATLNKASEVSNASYKLQNDITTLTSDKVGPQGWFNALLGVCYNGLQVMFGSLGFLGAEAVGINNLVGTPLAAPMVVLIGLIVIVIIAFAIYAAIMRVNV